MFIKNNKGPEIAPRGITESTAVWSNETPSRTILYTLLRRNTAVQLSRQPCMSWISNLLRRISWITVLNALKKSNTARSKWVPVFLMEDTVW